MGLLGMIGAGIANAASVGADLMGKEYIAEIEANRQLALEEARARLKQKFADEERTKKAEAVGVEEKAIANQRGAGLINSAKSAYADNPEGLAAVADAEKRGAYDQEPTYEDRIRAEAKLGYRDTMDVARLEKDKEAGIRADREATVRAEDKKADNAREDKRLDIAKRQLESSLANGEITRQEHKLRLAELEKQNDPAARSLIAQGLTALSKGDKEGAMEAFRVAGSHYGNKDAIDLMAKISSAKGSSDLNAIASLYRTAAQEGDAELVDEAKAAARDRMKNQPQPGEGGKPGIGGSKIKIDPAKYPEGSVLKKNGVTYDVKGGYAIPRS